MARRRGRRSEQILDLVRAEAEHGELEALRHFADRFEGRMALEAGDLPRAAECLELSAEGFARLGAPWEEAWSRLLLVESTAELGPDPETEAQLSLALPTFERLGSIGEIERAKALLDRLKSPSV